MRLSAPARVALPVLALVASAAVLRPSPQSAGRIATVPEGVRVRWGLAVDCEGPFHVAGDTLHARAVLVNGSAEDAAHWNLVNGGNGCNYRFEILDNTGRRVWQPGSLINGVFQGPGCVFGGRGTVFPAGTELEVRASIPLVYQNAAGFGPQGQPLAPGHYWLEAHVHQFGPERPPAPYTSGLNYSARVPLLVE